MATEEEYNQALDDLDRVLEVQNQTLVHLMGVATELDHELSKDNKEYIFEMVSEALYPVIERSNKIIDEYETAEAAAYDKQVRRDYYRGQL